MRSNAFLQKDSPARLKNSSTISRKSFQKKEHIFTCPYCNYPSDLEDTLDLRVVNFKYVKDTLANQLIKKEIIENVITGNFTLDHQR